MNRKEMILRAAEAEKAIWAARNEFTKAIWAENKGYLMANCQFSFSTFRRFQEDIPYQGDERVITFNAGCECIYEPVFKFATEAIAWAYEGLQVREKLYQLYKKEYIELYGEDYMYSYDISAPTVILELSTYILSNKGETTEYKPTMIFELDELEKNGFDEDIFYNIQLRRAKQDGTKLTPAGGRCSVYEEVI